MASKKKKPAGDEAEFGTEWAELLRKLPETADQREGARGLLRHRLKLQALPADNPYREGLADLTDADILNSIRDRVERDRLDVEFDALVKLPDEGPTAMAERWSRLADWGLRRFERRGSVDFTDDLWVRGRADGIGLGDDGSAVAKLPADGSPLKLRWLAALQSATDALAVAARDLVNLKRLDAADLRAVRVLADLLVKVDEGGPVDLREAVDVVAIVARELATRTGQRDPVALDVVNDPRCKAVVLILTSKPQVGPDIAKDQRCGCSYSTLRDVVLPAMTERGMIEQTRKRGPFRLVSAKPTK